MTIGLVSVFISLGLGLVIGGFSAYSAPAIDSTMTIVAGGSPVLT